MEDDPVAKAIAAFMMKRTEWSGTTTALLLELTERDRTEQKVSRQKDWPKDAIRFGGRLRSVAASLSKIGIEIEHGKAPDRNKTRMISLKNIFLGRSDVADVADVKTKSRPKAKSKAGKTKPTSERPQRPNVRKLPSPTRQKRRGK